VLRGEGSDTTLSPMQRGGTLAKESALSQGSEARQLHKVRVGSTHQTLSSLQRTRTDTLI